MMSKTVTSIPAEYVREAEVKAHKYAPIMDGTICCQYCMVDYPAKDPVCKMAIPSLAEARAAAFEEAAQIAENLPFAAEHHPSRIAKAIRARAVQGAGQS